MSTLRFEENGNTGFITLTDPPDNKIGSAFNKEFREALHEVAVSDVRALVVRSEGENFCNGADVLEFAKLEPKIFRTLVNEVHLSFRLLESLRIPTIASVQGMAVGGGFELALACDFLVVEASATLFSVEVMGGMLPGAGGIQRIADRLGRARTIRMMLLAEPISGEQAAALGIATHVIVRRPSESYYRSGFETFNWSDPRLCGDQRPHESLVSWRCCRRLVTVRSFS